MWLTPSSMARRRTAIAASRSAGGPITCGPASCMAPYPIRWTDRSPSGNEPDFSAVNVMPDSYTAKLSAMRPGRENPARARGSRLEQHLDRAVPLLPEVHVGLRGLLQRHVVRGELVDAEEVLLEQRQDVGHPPPDVGLTHAQLDLLVEHPHERQRVGGPAVDARQRDRAAA